MEFSISTIAYDLHKPVEARLREFRAAGFTAVDWTEQYASTTLYSERDAQAVLRLCEQVGIRVCMMHGATHLTLEGDLEHRDKLWVEFNRANLRFISVLGGNCVVVHLPRTSKGSLRNHVQSSRQLLDQILPCAERNGVKIGLENSPGGSGPHDYWAGNRELIGLLLEKYPPEQVGMCFDSGHANIRNELDMLDLHAKRVIAVHLHDNDGIQDQHLLPGQGSIAWDKVLGVLKHCGYSGPINLEVAKPDAADKTEWSMEACLRIKRLWKKTPQTAHDDT